MSVGVMFVRGYVRWGYVCEGLCPLGAMFVRGYVRWGYVCEGLCPLGLCL